MPVTPRKKVLGDRLPVGSVGPRQVVANPTTKLAMPPIHADRFARNGKSVDAQMLNMLAGATNANVLYRSKEVFRALGPHTLTLSSTAGSRPRFRSAMHSGPYTHSLLAIATLMPPNNNQGNDTYAKLTVYSDATETTTVDSAEFHYGAAPGTGTLNGWEYIHVVMRYITVSADTDYYLKWSDENFGRLQSACVIECPTMTGSLAGYLAQNITNQSSIVDTYRESIATIQRALWRRGAAHTFNWFVNNGLIPINTTTTTSTNVIDFVSTAVSGSTPGYRLDMTGKARLSQTAVPVIMRAFGSVTGVNGGRVTLKDSAGNNVLQIANAWTAGVASWQSVSGTLPAGVDKYDLHWDCGTGGANFNLYAVSLWEQET